MTTFTSRKVIREAVAALFTGYAPATFKAVYDNWPNVGQAKGQSPILIITSSGTGQEMAGRDTNPRSFRILITVLVKVDVTNSEFSRAASMDKIDTLDALVAQVIRDNAGNANWDNVQFGDGMTEVDSIIFEGLPYMAEVHPFIFHLNRGAI
jgi:hypothetical protein